MNTIFFTDEIEEFAVIEKPAPDDYVTVMDSPYADLLRVEIRQMMAVTGMTPKQRVVFDLYFIQGASHDQIAGGLGITPQAVNITLKKAKARADTYQHLGLFTTAVEEFGWADARKLFVELLGGGQ